MYTYTITLQPEPHICVLNNYWFLFNNIIKRRREFQAQSSMEWINDKVLELIERYRDHPCLWDPTSKLYKLTNKKNDAWNDIANTINCDVLEVKKKMNSLLASFRRERQKEGKKRTGSGSDEIYHSTWFAFKSMGFLMDKFKPRATECTDKELNPIDQESNEDVDDSFEEEQNTSINEDQNTKIQNEEEIIDLASPSTSTKSSKKTKEKGQKRSPHDARLDEALNIIKDVAVKRTVKTGDSIYGQYIASKLAGYSTHCKSIVQHSINNILFEADMGKFDQPTPYNNWIPSHQLHGQQNLYHIPPTFSGIGHSQLPSHSPSPSPSLSSLQSNYSSPAVNTHYSHQSTNVLSPVLNVEVDGDANQEDLTQENSSQNLINLISTFTGTNNS